MMKVIFDKAGKFVHYEEKDYYDGVGDVIKNRVEKETDLWFWLKEAVKGKNVRIIVVEEDNDDSDYKSGVGRGSVLLAQRDGNVIFIGYNYDSFTAKEVVIKADKFYITVKGNGTVEISKSKDGRKSVQYRFDFDDEDRVELELG